MLTNKELICEWVENPFTNSCNNNMSTSEGRLYSYETCIAEYVDSNYDAPPVLVNVTTYSNTTSHHLSILLRELSDVKKPITALINVPIGSKTLSEYARL